VDTARGAARILLRQLQFMEQPENLDWTNV
jgi:hypothetical protein